jgi:hypothetical protein
VVKKESTLALFVTRVFADDTDDTFATDDAAKFAEGFDGGTDTHTWKKKGESLGELKTPPWSGGRDV